MTSHARRARPVILALAGLLVWALAGVSPAAADSPALALTPAEELRLGQQTHPRFVESFGGVYPDQRVADYINRIGARLVRETEMPERPFVFTVLDSDTVNAFAVPGGFVYLTRGLLATINNEAELAGVMAHEIGHVTGRHAARQRQAAEEARLRLRGLGRGNRAALLLAAQATQLRLLQFNREQEFEADDRAVRYMTRAGYDPFAMASFLDQLRRESEITTLASGGRALPPPELLSTHPRLSDRITRAAARALEDAGGVARTDREEFLAVVDGLTYGPNPGEGELLEGRTYLNLVDDVGFVVPDGFSARQRGSQILARHHQGGQVLVEAVDRGADFGMVNYLVHTWAPGRQLRAVEPMTINGFPAATGLLEASLTRGGRAADLRLLAIQTARNRVYQFLYVIPQDSTQDVVEAMQRSTFSFRRMTESDRRAVRPRHLYVYETRRADTLDTLVSAMDVPDFPLQRFLALNGLSETDAIDTGTTVKLVARRPG